MGTIHSIRVLNLGVVDTALHDFIRVYTLQLPYNNINIDMHVV